MKVGIELVRVVPDQWSSSWEQLVQQATNPSVTLLLQPLIAGVKSEIPHRLAQLKSLALDQLTLRLLEEGEEANIGLAALWIAPCGDLQNLAFDQNNHKQALKLIAGAIAGSTQQESALLPALLEWLESLPEVTHSLFLSVPFNLTLTLTLTHYHLYLLL